MGFLHTGHCDAPFRPGGQQQFPQSVQSPDSAQHWLETGQTPGAPEPHFGGLGAGSVQPAQSAPQTKQPQFRSREQHDKVVAAWRKGSFTVGGASSKWMSQEP